MSTATRVMRVVLRLFFSVGVIWGLYFLRDFLWFRLYPLVMSSVVWGVFVRSLFKVPLVEIFARRMGEDLDAAGIRYCRRVTQAWVIFLTLHLGVTTATLFMSHWFWALYNGCLAYVLMGGMFVGEFIIRKWVKDGSQR